jgi:hypothetical protein
MFELQPLRDQPFAHVLVDDYLEPELFRELAASFPDCQPKSGPTGYTCFWGDPEYDELLASSPAWRRLFETFHSQEFIEFSKAQFADAFADECVLDLSGARYVPYVESRADKERKALAKVEHAPDELWVRVDIMQGRPGYDRAPHLDHRRRAVTLLIYFSDADDSLMEGGDLLLHGDADAAPVRIRPRENRMVAFACTSKSLHSVAPIVSQARPRNFVQVTLSSSVDVWRDDGKAGGLGGLLSRARNLFS